MIVRGWISHAKADRNFVQEGRRRKRLALRTVIIARAKNQFINTRDQLIACEQWRIGAAVRIGGRGF